MEPLKPPQTVFLINGPPRNSELLTPRTYLAGNVMGLDIGSTETVGKLSERIAAVQSAWEQVRWPSREPKLVSHNGDPRIHATNCCCISCVNVRGYIGGQNVYGQPPLAGHGEAAGAIMGGFNGSGQLQAAQPGVKLDNGKAPVAQGFVAYFYKAMEAISRVSQYGKEKYKVTFSEQNWRKVEDGKNRYADALQRHWGRHLAGELIDEESGKPHLDMVGWNACALIELRDATPEKLV